VPPEHLGVVEHDGIAEPAKGHGCTWRQWVRQGFALEADLQVSHSLDLDHITDGAAFWREVLDVAALELLVADYPYDIGANQWRCEQIAQ
jgi:hypothetical protein